MNYPNRNTTIVEAARIYASLGLTPIPVYGIRDGVCTCHKGAECHAPGKHPVGKDWQSRPSDPESLVGHDGNIGVALQGRHVLIDYDGTPGFESLLHLDPEHPTGPPPTAHQRSGSGKGGHFIYRLTDAQDGNCITDRRVAPGLDIKTSGQFVAAPSRHASGGYYEWRGNAPIADLPDWIYRRIVKSEPVAPVAPKPSASPTAGERRVRAYIAKIPGAISGQGGHDQTFAAAQVIVKNIPDEATRWALACEYNARCEPPWSESELRHKLADAERVGRMRPLEDRPLHRAASPAVAHAPAESTSPTPPPTLRLADPETDTPDWRSQLLYSDPDKHGVTRLLRVPENAAVILAHDDAWRGRLYYDTFACRVNTCGSPVDDGATTARAWGDVDTTKTEGWLARHYGLILQWAAVDRAVQQVAQQHRRSTLVEWLGGLTWDGTPRAGQWLVSYLGAADGEWPRLCGQWWLISAVARAYQPGCKVDHALILEGPQGSGKSSAIDALVPYDEWRSDTPLELGHKDAMQSLPGRWIIELAELDSLLRARSNEAAKAFFSSRVDTYRPSYARYSVQVARQSIFAGTHNPAGGYLTDETGARRLWPVLCGAIDLPALRRDRDQLWAEAVTLYRAGARWWPVGSEHELAAAEQAARATDDDPWVALLVPYLSTRTEVTVSQVLGDAIRVREQDWTRRDQMRASAILRSLGWVREQRGGRGDRQWVYLAPPGSRAPIREDW